MTLNKECDLLIIGAGVGGYEAAIKAAENNLNVIIIEKDQIGGTCLNRGCIPTKALYRNAEILKNIKESSHFGIDSTIISFDMNKVLERKNSIVNQLKNGIISLLNKPNIELIQGVASFINPYEVNVITAESNIVIKPKTIILATGSSPKIINPEWKQVDGVITSDEILDLDIIPKDLVIVGGGVIGVEMASIFSQFGSSVTILEAEKYILPLMDEDLGKRLKVNLKNNGINIINESRLLRIEKEEYLMVSYQLKDKTYKISCNNVLLSIGRAPYVKGLNLEVADIEYSHKGIVVNESFQTNQPHIYAIGDCIGGMMLAHTASYQAFKVVDAILGNENHTDFNLTPACVFTFPEVATVGLSETLAKNIYGEVKTYKSQFKANGKALCLGESDGFVKIVTTTDLKIIGISIIGPHASDLINEATIILNHKISVEEINQIIHPHPTLGEVLSNCIHQINEKR